MILDINGFKKLLIFWASQKPFVTKVYLFGSQVTGISHKTGMPPDENSDLDVAITFTEFRPEEDLFTTWIGEAKCWRKEIAKLLNIPVKKLDLQWSHDAETPHVAEYLKVSELIYEKNKN